MNDKMNAIINTVILVFAIALFFAGAIMLGRWLNSRRNERINACHIRTTGHICEWQRGIIRVEKVWVEYFVDNKRYKVRGTVPHGADIDTTMSFGVLYNQEYPAISRIDFASPFFDKKKMIKTTRGRVDFIDTISATVLFSYDVGEATFTCGQVLPEGRTVNIGETYPVEYLEENPPRGILKLDIIQPNN